MHVHLEPRTAVPSVGGNTKAPLPHSLISQAYIAYLLKARCWEFEQDLPYSHRGELSVLWWGKYYIL